MSVQLITGVANASSTVTNYYLPYGGVGAQTTESISQGLISTSGILKNLKIKLSSAPGASKSYDITLYKNGTVQLLTVNIADSATTGSDLSNEISVAAGDAITIEVKPINSPTAVAVFWEISFTPTTSGETILLSNSNGVNMANNQFFPAICYANSTIEANVYMVVPCAGTIKNLFIKVSNAPTQDFVYTVYKNENPQILTVTISGAATTGNDTVNSFTVAAGDTVSIKLTKTSATNPKVSAGLTFLPDTAGQFILGYISSTENLIKDNYFGLCSTNNSNATESNVNQIFSAFTLKNLYVILSAAPGASRSRTFTLRKNASSQVLTVTISTTGKIGNSTADVSVSDADLLDTLQSESVLAPGASKATVSYTGYIVSSTVYQKTILSDAKIKIIDIQKTITSDAIITSTVQKEILSDAKIKIFGEQKTILSDAKIKIIDIQKTITSDAKIIYKQIKTILSDAKIKVLGGQKTILSDSKIVIPAEYGTDIKYYDNKLYISCGTSPVKYVVVDITGDDIVGWDTYILSLYNNANCLIINSTMEKFFLGCDSGKIVKVDINTLIDTEIDVSDSDNIITLDNYPEFDKLYAGTNNSNYEFYLIDNAIINTVDTHFVFLKRFTKIISNVLSFVFKKVINTDFRFLLLKKDTVKTDLRFNLVEYISVPDNLVSANDFTITINGASITDFIQTSVRITLNADEKSQAEFTLTRKHDRLNYTLEGVYNQITNNNVVTISIKGILIFNGKINSLDCSSSNESVTVHAKGDEYAQDTTAISLSLPSLNEQLHPYHVLINDITINNPYIDPAEENPEFYKGIIIDLGTYEKVSAAWREDMTYASMSPEDFEEFIPEQNYTYFWLVKGNNFITNWSFGTEYIGTSLAPIYSDTYESTGIGYYKQIMWDDVIIDLGNYTLGSPPYKEISVKNGAHIVSYRWEDRADGLYDVLPERYNFIAYSKKVAATEYKKIQNINGQVLPRTSASITLTIDAFLYYNIKLLNRINIVNTTESGIYANSNGFPLSIKSMVIDSGAMKVDLRIDNEWSNSELDAIDATLPVEPEILPEVASKIRSKFDLPKEGYID